MAEGGAEVDASAEAMLEASEALIEAWIGPDDWDAGVPGDWGD